MSLMTTAHLLDRYGPLLTEEQLAQVLHVEPGTLRNTRATLGIPVIRRGRSPLYHAEDVAAYLDRMRKQAA
jgi:hypothetical protein